MKEDLKITNSRNNSLLNKIFKFYFSMCWSVITPFIRFWQKYAHFKNNIINVINNIRNQNHIHRSFIIFYTFKMKKNDKNLRREDIIILKCMYFLHRNKGLILNINQIFSILLLFDNKIVNLATGEGKTIISVVTAILNCVIKKKPNIIVNVNEFLVTETYKKYLFLFKIFNLKTAILKNNVRREILKYRIENYDIILSEIQNLVFTDLDKGIISFAENKKPIDWSKYIIILDEIDYVCIDKYKIPFRIVDQKKQQLIFFDYIKAYKFANTLKINKDYQVIYNSRNLIFKESFNIKFKRFYNLSERDDLNFVFSNNDNLCFTYLFIKDVLLAKQFIKKNIHYLVLENKIHIIDQTTGRIAAGNKYSFLMNLAVSMIEGTEDRLAKPKSIYLSHSTTVWRFMNKFHQVVGMSGTAYGVQKIMLLNFNTQVINVFRNKINKRKDHKIIFSSEHELKINKIIRKILNLHKQEIPILLCTPSINEAINIHKRLMTNYSIDAQLLLPWNLKKEKEYISNAGKRSKILISTNLSSRGTDIILGGNINYVIEKIFSIFNLNLRQKIFIGRFLLKQFNMNCDKLRKLGGVHVIKTSFNLNQRIDFQVLGRAGRQGEPGCSFSYSDPNDIIWRHLPFIVPIDFFIDLYKDKNNHPILDTVVPVLQSYWEKYTYFGNQNLTCYDIYLLHYLSQIHDLVRFVINISKKKGYFFLVQTFQKHLLRKYIVEETKQYRMAIDFINNINLNFNSSTKSIFGQKYKCDLEIDISRKAWEKLDQQVFIQHMNEFYINIYNMLKQRYLNNEFKFSLNDITYNQRISSLMLELNENFNFLLLKTIKQIFSKL